MLVKFHPFQTASGTEIYAGNLARSLEGLGCKVQIICTTKQSGTVQVTPGIKLTGVFETGYPLLGFFDDHLKRLRIVRRLLKESRFDVVIAVGTGQGLLFRELARMPSHPPLVYLTFDCMKREGDAVLGVLSLKKASLFKRNKTVFRYFKLAAADRISCMYSDLILASSADTKRSLNKYYKVSLDRIKVVYAGIPGKYTEGFEVIDPPEPTFLHVATDHERKGTVYLLKALSLIKEKFGLNIKTIIVGVKDPVYVSMAKDLGVNVSFLEVRLSKHKEIYVSCTDLVVPSVSEGFCLPVIEAAAFCKPAIVSDAGSLPELVENGVDGYVVPVADVACLAKCIHLLATNSGLVRCMAIEAKEKSRRFEIDNIAVEVLGSVKGIRD